MKDGSSYAGDLFRRHGGDTSAVLQFGGSGEFGGRGAVRSYPHARPRPQNSLPGRERGTHHGRRPCPLRPPRVSRARPGRRPAGPRGPPRAAIAGSCVTMTIVRFCCRFKAERISRISRPVPWSRFPVGSSASRSSGPEDQCPCNRRALHLPARQLPRLVLQPVRQPDHLQQLRGDLPIRSSVTEELPHAPPDHHRHQHVLQRGQLGQEVVELEDHPQPVIAEPIALDQRQTDRSVGRGRRSRRDRGHRASPAGAKACSCPSRSGRRSPGTHPRAPRDPLP